MNAPAPAEAIVGADWLLAATHTPRPFAGHAGSTVPETRRCWA